jgi:predicted lipoprotein
MPRSPHAERHFPSRGLLGVLAAAVLVIVFPPFHVRSLSQGKASPAAIRGAVDVPRVAEQFWTGKLLTPSVEPVNVRALMMAIDQDPAMAMKKYGHRAGIGGNAVFLVEGAGTVESVDARGVWLGIEVAKPLRSVLITGPVFGNALRDATGLLSINDFNSFDFNALGAELNRLAEARVQPQLRKDASVGSHVSFLAAGELDDASADRPILKLIPIRVTLNR